jgi:hypothetical protein
MSAAGSRGRAFLAAVQGLLAVALSGCTNGSPSLRTISVAPPVNTTIRFSADVQPIFTRSCAKFGCHAGAIVQQGLSLEEGKSYGNIVGVPSMEDPSLMRVNSGMSDLSYLVLKIEGKGLGDRMPADGPPYLPDAEIQLIRDWIDQGAPNN